VAKSQQRAVGPGIWMDGCLGAWEDGRTGGWAGGWTNGATTRELYFKGDAIILSIITTTTAVGIH
jgi:hypothetical protein